MTINDVLDHIDHVTKLVGVEHAGIGSDVDLDGRDLRSYTARRFDLDDIDYTKKIYDLTEGLVRRNYSSSNRIESNMWIAFWMNIASIFSAASTS